MNINPASGGVCAICGEKAHSSQTFEDGETVLLCKEHVDELTYIKAGHGGLILRIERNLESGKRYLVNGFELKYVNGSFWYGSISSKSVGYLLRLASIDAGTDIAVEIALDKSGRFEVQ